MAKLFERISSSIAAGRVAANPSLLAAQMVSGLPKTKRYILALVLEQTIEEAETTATTLAKIGKENDYRIILVTDQSEISFFQIDDCITEYLPPFASLANREGALPAETYLERRLNMLVRKWEPVQTIPFGESSEALYNFWQKLK